jgi:hypothetical protein
LGGNTDNSGEEKGKERHQENYQMKVLDPGSAGTAGIAFTSYVI